MSVFAPGLPASAVVQIVVGPVDKGGNSPGSSVVATRQGSQFTGASVVQVPPVVPSKLRHEVPGALDYVTLRCLAIDPSRAINSSALNRVSRANFCH